MYRTIIVDDEQAQQKLMQKMLQTASPLYEVVTVCSGVKEAAEQIPARSPDLVFLDVNMPPYTAFDLLEMLPKIDFEIIFCTAFADYAVKAFKVAAVDYLLKPFGKDELEQALRKFEEKYKLRRPQPHMNSLLKNVRGNLTDEKTIALPTPLGYEFVTTPEIIYCESVKNFTNFFLTSGQQLVVSRSSKECDELLKDFGFVRIHQQYIINPRHIKTYVKGDGGKVELANGKKLEVSRYKKKEFLDLFRKL
ncbi:MAG: LytTR family DNA-binding domain-containing protein [Flavobacteriales bacterium]|nr:LytTR family DNA-binding domain-containing protein [Flavobacteriales bacterium]